MREGDEQKSHYQSCGEEIRSNPECAGRYELCTYTWHTRALKVADCMLMVCSRLQCDLKDQVSNSKLLEQGYLVQVFLVMLCVLYIGTASCTDREGLVEDLGMFRRLRNSTTVSLPMHADAYVVAPHSNFVASCSHIDDFTYGGASATL
eukprot:888733-Amphidinium_carterae.2